LWNGDVQSSGDSDVLQLNFPTDLPASGYYAVFFYKEGYIPYEVKAWWHGDTTIVQSSNAYLSKKDVGRAPIDEFSVSNEVQPNVPLVITIDSSLDATTYSALYNAGPVGYVPSQLNNHYSVETEVSLNIYDAAEQVVHTDVQTVNIPYSGSERIEFSWTPTISGDYRAVATSLVTDAKFLTSEEHEVMSNFHVLEEDPNDMCYTLLNDLAVSNQFPTAGETITISGSKISNHADNDYILTPVPTDLVLEITDENGNVEQQTSAIDSNDNVVDAEGFSFEWTPENEGLYNISVTGVCNSALCNGVPNDSETEKIQVYVYGEPADDNGTVITTGPVLEGIPDQNNLNEGDTPSNIYLKLYASDEDTPFENLTFSIVRQSNSALTSCSINYNSANPDEGPFIECTAINRYGYSDVTVEVSDGEYIDRDSFRITADRINEAPVIGNIPNVNLRVGGSITLDLDDYVSDKDNRNSELSWTVNANNVNVAINPSSHVATISTIGAWTGQDSVVFTVTDPDGSSSSYVCVVTVDINGNPVIDDVPDVELKIGESVTFDLDDYVNDPDDLDSELTWNVDAENVNVEIDSWSHEATFTTRDDEWYGQETVIFTVTDPNGLSASDVCIVTVLDDEYPEPEKNKLTISRIIMNDIVNSNELLQLNVRLYNSGNQDLKNVRVDAVILDLEDVYDTAGPFEIEEDDTITKSLFLTLPDDVEPGYYYVRVSVDSNEVRRVIYREVIIV
jgi:hypothetical protein